MLQFGFSNFRECYGEAFQVSTDLASQVMALRQEGVELTQATPHERLEKLDAAVKQTLSELGYGKKEIEARETWVFYPFARGVVNRKKAEVSRWALKRISELSGELPMLANLVATHERVNKLPPWRPKGKRGKPADRDNGAVGNADESQLQDDSAADQERDLETAGGAGGQA